jgi:hypothetical protein
MTTRNFKKGQIPEFILREDGNMTIFSVFMVILILSISGAAVDIMRFEAHRTVFQSTMDRAVLAATDLDQSQDPKAVFYDYFDKMPIRGAETTVTVQEAVNSRMVTASGTSTLDTLFLQFYGFDDLVTPAASSAEEKIANVEISLVMDISGSMRFGNKLDYFQPAAVDFVNKVMTDDSNGVTTLNIVPFAGQVNPGDILFDYFRGERPKIKHDNNGWGNGDQDAAGNSLCHNNAENADEGAASSSCQDDVAEEPTTTEEVVEDFFPLKNKDIENVVFYFDTDDVADDIWNVDHRISHFPSDGSISRDVDDFLPGAVAWIMRANGITDHTRFLGASVKPTNGKIRYYQVKGDENGTTWDDGPTTNEGKLYKGNDYDFNNVDFEAYADKYVSPNYVKVNNANDLSESETANDSAVAEYEERAADEEINVNMPGSCIEIDDAEFANTNMPISETYIPHFMYWPIDQATMDWGWCPSERMAVQYYSDDREAMVEYIKNIRLHDGTGLQYGMKYGLALLDPANQGALQTLIDEGIVADRFAGRPIAWEDEETEKYIVLMTDGATTEQVRPTNYEADANADVDLQTQGPDTYTVLTTADHNVDLFLQQCALAQQNGVTIFAIGFEISGGARNDLMQCASSASHYFDADTQSIADVFDTVARQINNLRLIQ